MGLTLLAHASIPLKYWDEAFLTVVFLIDRLPSRVIQNEPPFEQLYGKQLDYSFLQTFGCVVWPNLRPYNSQKLLFRSKRCVFFGYSNIHKGFKCLDPSEGSIYVSQDVVFDEHVFPFVDLHPNAGARLRSEITLLSESLLNPNSTYGDAYIHDNDASILPTNTPSSYARSVCDARGNDGENGESFPANMHHFMCPHSRDSQDTRPDPDTVTTPTG
jgi:hypothetical protein